MMNEYIKLDVASNTAPARGGPRMADPPLNMVTSPKELVSSSIPTRSTSMMDVREMYAETNRPKMAERTMKTG